MATRHRPLPRSPGSRPTIPDAVVRCTGGPGRPVPDPVERSREAAVASGGKRAMSGPKGFAIVIGGMFGIMLVLWTLAAIAAP
ncbi:hypothetical protein GCM10010187_27440 [Actinomadura coerulea]|nr:hypothetical protein GCM10010187_27440 [Actinomadura coerulea]